MDGAHDALHSNILNCLEDPIFVIGSGRRVLLQNTAARRVASLGYGARVRSGILHLSTVSETSQLDQILLGHVARSEDAGNSCALRVAGSNGGKDWLLVCTAIVGQAEEWIFILHLVRRVGVRRVQGTALEKLFGLTPREQEMVGQLVTGAPLADVAEALGLSRESSRVYLKRIFRKCDVHSQVELVALVQRLSVFAPVYTQWLVSSGPNAARQRSCRL